MSVKLTPTKEMNVLGLLKDVLLRVSSGMGRYLSIALGKHSERGVLVRLI